MTRNYLGSFVLYGIAALGMACGAAQADTAFSNKWRIEISEGANRRINSHRHHHRCPRYHRLLRLHPRPLHQWPIEPYVRLRFPCG